MKVELKKSQVDVTITVTGEEAGWLAALCGRIVTGNTERGEFFARVYREVSGALYEADEHVPNGHEVVAVRDGRICAFGVEASPQTSTDTKEGA